MHNNSEYRISIKDFCEIHDINHGSCYMIYNKLDKSLNLNIFKKIGNEIFVNEANFLNYYTLDEDIKFYNTTKLYWALRSILKNDASIIKMLCSIDNSLAKKSLETFFSSDFFSVKSIRFCIPQENLQKKILLSGTKFIYSCIQKGIYIVDKNTLKFGDILVPFSQIEEYYDIDDIIKWIKFKKD